MGIRLPGKFEGIQPHVTIAENWISGSGVQIGQVPGSRGTAELHFVVWEFISRAMLYIQRGIWFNSLIAAKIRRVSRKCLEFAENECKITGSLSSWCLSQDFGILREDKRFNRMFVKVSVSLLIIG